MAPGAAQQFMRQRVSIVRVVGGILVVGAALSGQVRQQGHWHGVNAARPNPIGISTPVKAVGC